MSSLLLLNGSPRGPHANTVKMLSRLAEGWRSAEGSEPELLHLARPAEFAQALAAFPETGTVVLGMPLYTDAMPGLVMTFIEALAPRVGAAGNPVLAFVVQSGFPEALHSRPLERYFEKLARRLGSPYAGTIVHGWGGGLGAIPDHAVTPLWSNLRKLGAQLASEQRFGEHELRAVAGLERLSTVAAFGAALALRTPLGRRVWDRKFRRLGTWQSRFAAPYAPAARG